MCGINGIFNFNQQPVTKESLSAMNIKMFHRGPDDDGFFLDANLGLAMRRLAIIDLRSGQQPITNENGRYCIVFNGEIYNYLELREQLINKGHQFKTASDTEVIIHAFEENGPGCVNDFNGMFAFAIWDDWQKELYVFRDRLGVKPLYYRHRQNQFVFSSSLLSLIAIDKNWQINTDALLLFLGMSYVPYPLTIFQDYQKLEPGHYLKISNTGKLTKTKFWDIQAFDTLPITNETDYQEQILSILRDSIHLRRRSDVPIGAFLSGGLDSSAVVALLAKELAMPVRTFSIGFQHGVNELAAAQIIVDEFKTEHTAVLFDEQHVSTLLPQVIEYLDEPMSDNALLPTLILSQIARKNGIKVVFNGMGGDEIFGGYPRYINRGTLRKIIRGLPSAAQKIFGEIVAVFDKNRGIKIANPVLLFLAEISGVNFFLLQTLTNDNSFYHRTIENMEELFHQYSSLTANQTAGLMYFDLKSYLVDNGLAAYDKMTMAASVEGREPLLDYRLVELAFKIPTHLKISANQTKFLFRKTLQKILPPKICSLPKCGFSGPTTWWVNNLKTEIIKSLQQDNPLLMNILNTNKLTKILNGNVIPSSYCELIFAIYIFNEWYGRIKNSN